MFLIIINVTFLLKCYVLVGGLGLTFDNEVKNITFIYIMCILSVWLSCKSKKAGTGLPYQKMK